MAHARGNKNDFSPSVQKGIPECPVEDLGAYHVHMIFYSLPPTEDDIFPSVEARVFFCEELLNFGRVMAKNRFAAGFKPIRELADLGQGFEWYFLWLFHKVTMPGF